MTRFVVNRNLDQLVARDVLAPRVARSRDAVEREAQRLAPGVKTWHTARDERVRPSHRDADRQAVPDNLRYVLDKADGGPGVDLARAPRDPDLPVAQTVNCRCSSERDPDPLRDSIHGTPVHVDGTRVTSTVETRYPRAVESELGTDEDRPARFMSGACRHVAAL